VSLRLLFDRRPREVTKKNQLAAFGMQAAAPLSSGRRAPGR
jgi:hypothetical protein